jgi:cytochrome c peroxidase
MRTPSTAPPRATPGRLQRRHKLQATTTLAAVALLAFAANWAQAQMTVEEPPRPEGLKHVPVPEPTNLNQFVANKAAAIRLGKALFWDTQVGSDGKTACASCHFHAGADNRTRNQISPGLLRESSPGTPNPDVRFTLGGPNYRLKAEDFPFHRFSDPNDRQSRVVRSHNDVASSQGVFNETFQAVAPGASFDQRAGLADPVFQKDGLRTRRVEPRNSPSVINAIFNFRNFWDGRATFLFNGVNPFGAFDGNARVYRTGATTAQVTAQTVRIDHASLASLSTGPALSDFEMSARGRTWPQIGKRLLPAVALRNQAVHPNDSVLAGERNANGDGLRNNYAAMVRAAFRSEWWNSSARVMVNGGSYTQAEANFSLFFGLALQTYMATLVSDDAPFDRQMAGQAGAMSSDAAAGMALFFGKGECAQCHGGAEFTNASVRKVKRTPLNRMVMGNGGVAVYDEGFYNIAVSKTLEDVANGTNNPLNRPKSLTRLAQQVGPAEFQRLVGIPTNVNVARGERIAINGAFKTPGLRNVELTAPYFHDGSVLTLEQVVEFYNRGGNHFQNNLNDVDADIKPLGLSPQERTQLVAFLKSLTDRRVEYKRAPFDHPELNDLPEGSPVDANGRVIAFEGRAANRASTLPAVGRDGVAVPPPNFEDRLPKSSSYVMLKFEHSDKCMEVAGFSGSNGGNIQQWACNGGAQQQWLQVAANGGYRFINRLSGRCLDVSNIGNGANIHQWGCHNADHQIFNWVGNQLVAKHSGQCVNVAGGNTADGANVWQWPCQERALEDKLAKVNTTDPNVFNLVAVHSGRCVDVFGGGTGDGTHAIQYGCIGGAANQQFEQVPTVGGFMLRARHSGKCLDVAEDSRVAGGRIHQWTCNPQSANQTMNWVGNRLQFKSSGMCMNVSGAANGDRAGIIQWPCTDNMENDQFFKR